MDIRKTAFAISMIFTPAYAQNVQVQIGERAKVVGEMECVKHRTYWYNYMEGSKDFGFYSQSIAEPTIHKNISWHSELRTDMKSCTFINGTTASKVFKYGFVNVQILCRYEKKFYLQLSHIFSFEKNGFEVYWLADVWDTRNIKAYAEIRAFATLYDNVRIGAVCTTDMKEITPYVAIKIKLK